MANVNAPFGLRPVRYRNGSPWNGQVTPYYVRSDNASAMYIGDPVDIIGESNQSELYGFQPGALSAIDLATLADGNYCVGVIVAIHPVTADSLVYRAASTERIVYVCDDPDVVFQIQDDGTTALTYDSVGLNAIMQTGSGSTVTGKSGYVIDTNTDPPDADASNMLFILNLSNIVGNSIAAYAVWDVLINQHRYRPSNGLGVA